jgi:transposase
MWYNAGMDQMDDAFEAQLAPPSVGGALFLPGFEDVQIEEDPEGLNVFQMGEYTAAQFLRNEPFKGRIVIKLLARGFGQREIAEIAGCHVRTVRRIVEAMPEEIATETDRLKRKIRIGRKMLMDSILADVEDEDKMAKTPTRDKAVTLGILGDQLKSGGPASVTININAPDHRDLESYLAKLQPADVIEAEPAGMGLAWQGGEAKGGWIGGGLEDEAEDADLGEEAPE